MKRGKNKPKRHNVPITQTVSFEKGVVFKEPLRQYSDNGNCCMLKGVEFITQISVYTTANASPGSTGDIIYTLPLAPLFVPVTDLYKEGQFWTKWRWRKVHVHYIPSCPSTTNGALIAWGEPDIERVTFSILSDGPSRVREALARKGAKMFHPFKETTIEVALDETAKNLWYDTFLDVESELTIPSQLYVMLESAMTDPNAQTTMSAGQLLLDYEIEFCEKSMIDGPIPTPSTTNIFSGTASSLFTSITIGSGVNMFFSALGLGSILPELIYVIIFPKRVFDTTTSSTIPVTSRYSNGNTPFGYQGSVVYGFAPGFNNNALTLCPCIEDAIIKNQNGNFNFTSGLTGTDTITFTAIVYPFDISDLL